MGAGRSKTTDDRVAGKAVRDLGSSGRKPLENKHRVTVVHTADVAQDVCVFKQVSMYWCGCICAHAYIHVGACACGGQRTISAFFLRHYLSYFLRWRSLTVLELTN